MLLGSHDFGEIKPHVSQCTNSTAKHVHSADMLSCSGATVHNSTAKRVHSAGMLSCSGATVSVKPHR